MSLDDALETFGYVEIKSINKKQLKSDYRKLGKLYHPDNIGSGNASSFKKLVQAYKYLCVWLADNEYGSAYKGSHKFDYSELEDSKNASQIRDVDGVSYERVKVVNSNAYILFSPTVCINDTIIEDIIFARYSMIGSYELYLEVEIGSNEEIEKIRVELCGQERELQLNTTTQVFEFLFSTDIAKIKFRLNIKKAKLESKNEYIVCKDNV